VEKDHPSRGKQAFDISTAWQCGVLIRKILNINFVGVGSGNHLIHYRLHHLLLDKNSPCQGHKAVRQTM